MVRKISDNSNKFSIKNKEYEVFFAEDDQIEVYEVENPGKTGFIFSDLKNLILFINTITDIAEDRLKKE